MRERANLYLFLMDFADLFIELMGVLTCYSINVKEMKSFMQALQAKQHIWVRVKEKSIWRLQSIKRAQFNK